MDEPMNAVAQPTTHAQIDALATAMRTMPQWEPVEFGRSVPDFRRNLQESFHSCDYDRIEELEQELLRNPDVAKHIYEHRSQIDALERSMAGKKETDEHLRHFKAYGLYGRELFIPQGTCYVGKIHRYSHFRFVLAGHLMVVTEDGRHEYKAPHFMITPAGTRRVGYAFEDTFVFTAHACESADVGEIEREITVPRSEQLLLEQS
jgi:hypothetical protein